MRASIRFISNGKCIKSISICGAVLTLLSMYYLSYRRMTHGSITYKPNPEFRAMKEMNGVHTFSNVCIEELATPKLENRLRMVFKETKEIVIYGNNSKVDGARITINVAGSGNSMWNHWKIHFRQQVPPSGHNWYTRDTAFFVATTFPGNFHHFFTEEFIPLYSVIALSNRLHPGARNQILYRTPHVESNDDRIGSRRTYEGMLRTLYIDNFHDVFYNLPNHTCFRHAVFGSRPRLSRQRDVVDHVLRYHNLTLHNRNASNLYVTILQRQDRRIVNADEVLSFAKEVGFKNLRIVDFSGKSILYQLEIMSTSNVLIGVDGAGLQWSVFMPEGSCLIEFAWPQKHWRFFYDRFIPPFGITWRGVSVQDVRLNWTSYETNLRRGVKVSEAEKPKLIQSHPKDRVDNIWKWCDIYVQKNETLDALIIAYRGMQKIG